MKVAEKKCYFFFHWLSVIPASYETQSKFKDFLTEKKSCTTWNTNLFRIY